MFLISKPGITEIDDFIDKSQASDFSYSEPGTSRERAPYGYNVDKNRISLGVGDIDFENAKAAVRNWKMFDFPWVELRWADTQIEVGATAAILVRHFGFYSLNAARIVYVIDELNRFGFAYGTLMDHSESGEERFTVEMEETTGEVFYDLFAFSRPNHILAKVGYPFARRLQKRFAKDSLAAMKLAVERGKIS